MVSLMPSERAEQARLAILIVDDEPAITRTLARSLRDRFTVFTASSADAALDIIAREPIAIILTDQRMPDLSGVQLLERAHALRPQAIGILISGYTDASALVDALNLGNVRGFLPKPWDIHQLRRQLDQAIRTYQAAAAEAQAKATDEGAAQTQAQQAEVRQALDQLNGSYFSVLFDQWEHAQGDVRYGPDHPHLPTTFVTSLPANPPLLAERAHESFTGIVAAYAEILDRAVEQRYARGEVQHADYTRAIGERLGTLWAGPRDVVEIHTAALRSRVANAPASQITVYVEAGRLLLPELIGNLVVFYRGWLTAAFTRRGAPAADVPS